MMNLDSTIIQEIVTQKGEFHTLPTHSQFIRIIPSS